MRRPLDPYRDVAALDAALTGARARGWRNRSAAAGDLTHGRVTFTAPLPLPPVVATAVVDDDGQSLEYIRTSARVDLVGLRLSGDAGDRAVTLADVARAANMDADDVRDRLHAAARAAYAAARPAPAADQDGPEPASPEAP